MDDVSPYRDLHVTDICQHVNTCHHLMLARVKMDEKDPGGGPHMKRTGSLVVPFRGYKAVLVC